MLVVGGLFVAIALLDGPWRVDRCSAARRPEQRRLRELATAGGPGMSLATAGSKSG